MTWTTLAPVIVSVLTALGASELLKLAITRRTRRSQDVKIHVETEAVISSELRQWTTEAEKRARAAEARAQTAEERADQTEARLQARVDQLCDQLDAMKDDVTRLRLLIRDCTAGPPCPVRIAIDRHA